MLAGTQNPSCSFLGSPDLSKGVLRSRDRRGALPGRPWSRAPRDGGEWPSWVCWGEDGGGDGRMCTLKCIQPRGKASTLLELSSGPRPGGMNLVAPTRPLRTPLAARKPPPATARGDTKLSLRVEGKETFPWGGGGEGRRVLQSGLSYGLPAGAPSTPGHAGP